MSWLKDMISVYQIKFYVYPIGRYTPSPYNHPKQFWKMYLKISSLRSQNCTGLSLFMCYDFGHSFLPLHDKALLRLMAWCLSIMASLATTLIAHPCVFSGLCVNHFVVWLYNTLSLFLVSLYLSFNSMVHYKCFTLILHCMQCICI